MEGAQTCSAAIPVPEARFGSVPGAGTSPGFPSPVQTQGQCWKQQIKKTHSLANHTLNIRHTCENPPSKSRQGKGSKTLTIMLHKNSGIQDVFLHAACNF